jgi:putative transcriptional regulator
MGLKYKIDVLAQLSAKGYTSYRLRKEKLLSESTIQKLRNGEGVAWENLSALCGLLDCQPGDIIGYIGGNADDH